MPKGPKGEKRHADTVQNAILIGRIATGEIEDVTGEAPERQWRQGRRSRAPRFARF